MSARTDVCAKCEKHRSSISHALTEEEKTEKLMAFQAHIVQAQLSVTFIRRQLEELTQSC